MAVVDVRLEAVGEGFAQVSGEWIENERVAMHLREARRVWAFFARDDADACQQMDALPVQGGQRIIGIAPGVHPDWGQEGRQAILRLLGSNAGENDIVGLFMAVDAPVCRCPHRQGEEKTCGGCAGCHATNGPDSALYSCNERKQL